VNPDTKEYYFLEVNPRLQVEHTITESITMSDIVKAQLLLAQGATLKTCGLPNTARSPMSPPLAHSIQFRITAENVEQDWSLSIGKITGFQFPTGNGIRVDTHLINGHSAIVSADFDSLIAKIVVTAASWKGAVRKAQCALADTSINGIKTNIPVLRALVSHRDFVEGQCDTQWLTNHHDTLLGLSRQVTTPKNHLVQDTPVANMISAAGTTNTLFRKGDAWSLSLSAPGTAQAQPSYHLEITKVGQNDFPTSLSAEILFSTTSASVPYTLKMSSTGASATAATSHHRRANPSDASHVAIPFPGKLVELLVDEGDVLKEGDVICVVQQMKMELEVRSGRSGRVTWVMEVEDGGEVDVGWLAAVIESDRQVRL
jgi:pyruvate carboxylase